MLSATHLVGFGGRTAAPSATTLLLDETGLGSAAAAYSVRKLRAAYAGSAIRVRRSSDSTEQDIGFSGNDLDESALTTFCGAGDGFVVTWYDQSGNARNVTQATTTRQPRIVSSGTVDKINGKPAAYFDGGDVLVKTAMTVGDVVGSSYESHVHLVMQQAGAQASNVVFAVFNVSSECQIIYATAADAFFFENGNQTTRRVTVAQPTGWDDAQHVLTCYSTGSDGYIRTDGVQRVTSGVSGTPTKTTSTNMTLGALTSALSTPMLGYIQEAVVWATDGSNYATGESNANAYFGVY